MIKCEDCKHDNGRGWCLKYDTGSRCPLPHDHDGDCVEGCNNAEQAE